MHFVVLLSSVTKDGILQEDGLKDEEALVHNTLCLRRLLLY
jgi:hypothetical protein